MHMFIINVKSNSNILNDVLKLEKRSNIKLNSFEKILLINNGTTEQFLQILSNSLTKIVIMQQTEKNNIITRKINIITKDQGKILAVANSIIYLKNLPNKIKYEIRKGEKGIGMIILENKLETYKRITEIGYNSKESYIYRKYKLLSGKHIISRVLENFLIGIYD
jgi:chorismate-pyruvate lyase